MSYIDSVRFYQEFRIEQSPDFSSNTIMATLFYKIHCCLVDRNLSSCGISFPEYTNKSLGTIVRLHSRQSDLIKVQAILNLKSLQDHLICTDILEIPSDVKFAIFKREHVFGKSSIRRLNKRRQLRDVDIDPAQIHQDLGSSKTKSPYVIYHSASTGKQFSLFIKKEDFNVKSMRLDEGCFNKFGLCADNASYVPIF